MVKLNIAKVDYSTMTFYKEQVKATPVSWHKKLNMFYYKKDNRYYLTEYYSGSIIETSKTVRTLREKLDKAVRKYGVHKIKKEAKRIMRISKIIANQ